MWLTMSAIRSSPWSRSPSTACSLEIPAGSRSPKKPAKIRSVAWPRMRGPSAIKVVLQTASSTTPIARTRSGAIRRIIRLAEGPKVIAFCPTWPPPIGPRPGPGPATIRSVSFMRGRCRGGHAALLRTELGLDDLLVRRVVGEQLVVRAATDHAAVLEHHDQVGVADGRDPLRDDQHRRVAGDRLERRAQPGVGGQVERGERVVEDVDLRLADQRPGDGQPLPLAAGDVAAALGDRGLQAVGHRLDEVAALGDLQGLPHLFLGRVRLAVPQVVGDGPGEQERLLRDQAEPGPEQVLVEVADVDTVHLDRCRRWRRTAAAAGSPAWSCRHPVEPITATVWPGPGREADVAEHRLVGARGR